MAEVTVFIDDAVRGTLPALCIKEGVPTGDRLTVSERVSGSAGLGVAWLLILFGPLGWLVLFIIACTHRPADYVTANLPFSEFAYRRMTVARRMMRTWTGLSLASAVLALVLLMYESPAAVATSVALGVFFVAALVSSFVEAHRLRLAKVGLGLDASRRWLTISGVHPDFARAAQEQAWGADRIRHPASDRALRRD
ncbi:MAG TPA: hypothetical protein VGL48_17455 [Acidimicrobiales bacterium]